MEIVFFANDCNVLYIENELSYLLKNTTIDKLIIYTEFQLRDIEISEHPRVEIRFYGEGLRKVGISKKIRILCQAIPIMFYEYLNNRRLYKSQKSLVSKFNELRNEMLKAEVAASKPISDTALFYSYWGAHEAFIMCILRRKGFDNKNITRLHGFDLYEELDNGVPFRWFIRRYIDKYVTISEHGRLYFISRYPELKDRIKTFHLGIDFDPNDKLNEASDDVIRVVSCGWVNHHKNYDSIFFTLNEMNGVEWLHLGGGGIIDDFKAMIEPSKKIKVTFTGLLNREEIFEYYRNTRITCFMSLSTTEGLPVSMMEAQAFGIPIISSDVGGCGEIVNENTGILLSKNYSIEEVQKAVMECATRNWTDSGKRKKIREHAVEHFSSGKNYAAFYHHITDGILN